MPGTARQRRHMAIEDLFRLQLVGSPALAPDGARCVVVVQRCDREKNKYFSNLHLIELGSGEVRPITSGEFSDTSPVWSPDGQALAFISTRSESAQVHLMPMGGGDSRQLTKLDEGSIAQACWSPDGRHLLITYRPVPPEDRKAAREEREKQHHSAPARHIDTAFYREDGVGYFGALRPQLLQVDAQTGETKQLTRGRLTVERGVWSPDGKQIAYTAAPDLEQRPYDWRLYVLPARGGRARLVPTPLGPKGALVWSPDGRLLAYAGYACEDDPWGVYNTHVWVVGPTGRPAARDVLAGRDVACFPYTLSDVVPSGSVEELSFSPNGAALDVLVGEEGATHLWRVPLAGGKPRVLVGGHVHVYAKTPEVRGRLVCALQTPTDPGEVHLIRPAGGERRQLTHLNAGVLAELSLTRPEEVWVRCRETGRRVQGWVLKPPGFQRGRRYPLVLEIHGGPHTQYGAGFFHEFHWLAAQGYVVLFTNPAGSEGRGEAFMQALRHHWGEADYPELMACVDAVVGRGYIDERRLAVTGGSYGGFMTNWVVGHTKRFAAAATQRSVTNLVSMAGNSDFPMHPESYFEGNAWTRPEELWRLSPLRLAAEVRTPLLILHSEGDRRCNIEQAEQLFSALKMLKRKVRFVRFPLEASHGLSRGGPPDLRVQRLEAIGEWFGEHLGRRQASGIRRQ